MYFVFEYQQTDDCNYWADQTLFIEASNESIAKSFIVNCAESGIERIKSSIPDIKKQMPPKDRSNKKLVDNAVNVDIDNSFFNINDKEVKLSYVYNFVNGLFDEDFQLTELNKYLEKNSIKI
jgi:hypothetical protein